jgi:hypothetical protein
MLPILIFGGTMGSFNTAPTPHQTILGQAAINYEVDRKSQELLAHIESVDPRFRYADWYVGIAKDPDRRLFSDHNVDRNGFPKHISATSERVAREIEKHLLDYGLSGGSGGGDSQTRSVYIYRRTSTTQP